MRKWIECMMVLVVASAGYCMDWTTWRGPSANGISVETGWDPKSAEKMWSVELGVGYSSVSVGDGRLYTMGHEEGMDTVYCLAAETGKTIWDYSYPCKTGKYKGPRATPVLEGGNLYTVSRTGVVYCFDALSGEVEWKTDVLKKTGVKNIRWGVSSSVVVEGNLLLLNIGGAGVALDKSNGEIAWKSRGKHSYATPVVFDLAGKRYAAVFSAPGLQIVEVGSGKKVSSYDWETEYDINGADPLIIGDRIFISSGYDRGCAMLDFSSGRLKKLWSSDVLNNHFSSSVHIDGYIYGIDGQSSRKGFLRCISAEDGAEQWNMPIGFGSLMAADGKLIALGERGVLYFAEATPKKYVEIHQMETGLDRLCWTPPVLANGIVYCRNNKGTLVAVDVRK